MYSTIIHKGGDKMDRKQFAERLIQLRLNKDVSARDMSLSIGQSPNYINHIENGKNFPSMTVFFYICDYFRITPSEFFNVNSQDPTRTQELVKAVSGLNSEQMSNLIKLARDLKRY